MSPPSWTGGLPPGGSSGPPPPPPVVWLDATYGLNTTSTWYDKSGNGNNATSVGSNPSLIAGAVNGLQAYYFDQGSSNALQIGSLEASPSCTVMAAIQYSSAGDRPFNYNAFYLAVQTATENVPYGLIYNNVNDPPTLVLGAAWDVADTSGSVWTGGSTGVWAENPGITVPGLLTGILDVTMPGGIGQSLYYNGTLAAQQAGGNLGTVSAYRYVGTSLYQEDPYNGYLCEILEFDVVLNSTALAWWTNYLKTKWGIP